MNTPDPSLVDKIAKLLRLSESSNQHEAELALSKAKQLAVENDIDLATVDKEPENESYEEGELSFGKRKPVTGRFVSWIVGKHFGVSIIYSGSRWAGQKVNFVGKPKDIQIATYVFNYLNHTFMSLWYKYKKDTGCSVSSRGSYFYGLYQGLDQKLTSAKAEAERNKFTSLQQEKGADIASEIKNQYSLMVVNNKEKLRAAVERFYPKLRKTATVKINLSSQHALENGFRDGKRIDIRPSIGSGSVKSLIGN